GDFVMKMIVMIITYPPYRTHCVVESPELLLGVQRNIRAVGMKSGDGLFFSFLFILLGLRLENARRTFLEFHANRGQRYIPPEIVPLCFRRQDLSRKVHSDDRLNFAFLFFIKLVVPVALIISDD